jgi:pimeloyl-ACP methyl ester carboxylesterase
MKKILRIILKTVLVLFLLINIITAFHAYKFTHFYNGGDVTIKKQEDKSVWDKTKEVFFGINAAKKQNTIVPDSTFQTVYLTTKNGLKLEAWYIAADSAKGTVALFHGHGGSKSGVFKESEEFRKMHYNTFLLDFRAHGGSEGNTCTIGCNESEDVKLAYDFIKEKGEKNIVLWGISMGAATITKTISDYSIQPGKVILEMPFGSILKAGEGRIKMLGLPGEPFAALVAFWGGVEHGFWAFSMKPTEFVKKINCPVLLQWGANDPRVTRGEMDEIYNNIPGSKRLVVYDSSGHESLCSKETEKWKTEVSAFLK